MDSVFIAARARVDENAAAPSAAVAGPNSTSLRVIVIGTSLSRETLPEAWRAGEGMSSRKVAPQGFETPDGRRRLLVARRPIIWRTVVERHLAESSDEPRLAVAANGNSARGSSEGLPTPVGGGSQQPDYSPGSAKKRLWRAFDWHV